jgi:hypothetical protein
MEIKVPKIKVGVVLCGVVALVIPWARMTITGWYLADFFSVEAGYSAFGQIIWVDGTATAGEVVSWYLTVGGILFVLGIVLDLFHCRYDDEPRAGYYGFGLFSVVIGLFVYWVEFYLFTSPVSSIDWYPNGIFDIEGVTPGIHGGTIFAGLTIVLMIIDAQVVKDGGEGASFTFTTGGGGTTKGDTHLPPQVRRAASQRLSSTLAGPKPATRVTPGSGTCPACGEVIEPGWKVCPHCTTPLHTCPHCHAGVQPGWKACPHCGTPLP